MPRCTFLSPCMHHLCSLQAAWLETRETAGRIDSSRHDQYRTQKGPPLFFCATLQLLIAPPHRATAGRPTLGARSVFFACEGESHLSPAPTPHTHRGGFQRTDGSGPFHLRTPPCHLGVSSRGGPKSVPPVSTIITRTCRVGLES